MDEPSAKDYRIASVNKSKPCEMWRKSRLAARILRRKNNALRPLSTRDIRLANLLAADPSVTNRLISQAFSWLDAIHARTAF